MKIKLLLLIVALVPKLMVAIPVAIKDRTIEGRVINEKNEPLIFAKVILVNSVDSVWTDRDGRFTIQVPEHCCKLQVNCEGYATQRLNVKGRDSLMVVMQMIIPLKTVIEMDYKVPLIECNISPLGMDRDNEDIRNKERNSKNIQSDSAEGKVNQKHKDKENK